MYWSWLISAVFAGAVLVMRTFGRNTVVVHVLLSLLVLGSPRSGRHLRRVDQRHRRRHQHLRLHRDGAAGAGCLGAKVPGRVWPDTLDGAGLADTYDRPAGSVSRTITLAAGAVPILRQVSWYAIVSLTSAVASPVLVMLTSGRWIVVVTVEELLPGVLSV